MKKIWVPPVEKEHPDATSRPLQREPVIERDAVPICSTPRWGWPTSALLLSGEHFSVNGTMIQAWASDKSMRRKDSSDDGRPPDHWRGETRSNETHESNTEADSRLYRERQAAPATKPGRIQSLTTGTDAIMKIASLSRDVRVTSTRGMHGPQMSELVFLQMLALARDFPRMQRNQAASTWERWPQPLLWGKTIVIVGVGAISEALALRCKAFGMTVYGVSNSPRVPEGFDGVFPRSDIARGAALADFLVLVVPYSPETESLVNANVLAALKPRAFLV